MQRTLKLFPLKRSWLFPEHALSPHRKVNGDVLIKLSNALEVEMWEMFDFGHVAGRKELKDAIQNFVRTTDEPALRLALKILRAVVR